MGEQGRLSAADPSFWSGSCGEEGQGIINVFPAIDAEGGWEWMLDMLPAAAEPVVIGRAATLDEAKAAALAQAAMWPALLPGATRDA